MEEFYHNINIFDYFSTNLLNRNNYFINEEYCWYVLLFAIKNILKTNKIKRPSINTITFTKGLNKKALRTVTIKKQKCFQYNLNVYSNEIILKIITILHKLNGKEKWSKINDILGYNESLKKILLCDKNNINIFNGAT